MGGGLRGEWVTLAFGSVKYIIISQPLDVWSLPCYLHAYSGVLGNLFPFLQASGVSAPVCDPTVSGAVEGLLVGSSGDGVGFMRVKGLQFGARVGHGPGLDGSHV